LGDSNPSSTPAAAGDTRAPGEGTLAGGAMLLRETVIALDPGSVLAGRYQIRRVVGKGATGVVLEADDRVSRSLVALKVFKPEIATDDRWQEIVGSELRHARRLSHPNVCRVFDAGEADGYRFLSMEYAPGGSLRQRLKDAAMATDGGGGARPMEERVADGRAVVDGLAAIHGAGIIHRDVKPDNVLRMDDGRLVVTDFGLAVAPGTTTFMSGYSGAVGTPSYMAPEVALGGDATMASDVFAVGVILHEIFFGRRPEWATTKRGRFVKPPAIRKGSRIERSMSRLCLECLEPLAPRRPQSAGELKKKYERAVLGRYGTFKGAMKAGKWGLVAGLVLAVGASGTVFWLSRRSSGIETATLVGTPADWSRNARLVARRDGPITCVYPSPDGQTIGLIAGAVPEPVMLDLRNGHSRPWPLTPDSYAYDCPQFSSDGRSLLYFKDGKIVLGDAVGASPRVLGRGSFPRWLPSENEVVHAFDARRLATTDLSGNMSLLPEVPISEIRLLDLLVDRQTREVVAHFARGTDRNSVLVFFDTEGGKIRRQVLMPVRVRAPFMVAPRAVSMVLAESPQEVVGLLTADGTIRRQGRLGSGGMNRAFPWLDHRLITVVKPTTTLSVRDRDGKERIVATAPYFGPISVARDGQAVFEKATPNGGSSVVNHYDPTSSQIRALTSGGQEFEPLVRPDGSGFFHIDGNAQRSLKFCALPDNTKCVTLLERGLVGLLGVSPGGQRVVVTTREGLRSRLRIFWMQDRSLNDLGPVAYHCPVRWDEEERLWTYARTDQFSGWSELDVRTGRPTGNRKPEIIAKGSICPSSEIAPHVLKRTLSVEAEMWRVPVGD
jgi:Protein kinase domain